MCVYLPGRICSLENCLSLFYYRGVDVLDVQESSQFWKELSCFFNYSPGGRCRKLAGRTTSAYRMVFNCTTTESVLKLVSMFQLACSSHRQTQTQLCLLIIVVPYSYRSQVDGQSLDGFTNVEAVDMLRNTGSVVHVKLARHPEGTLDISNVNMERKLISKHDNLFYFQFYFW